MVLGKWKQPLQRLLLCPRLDLNLQVSPRSLSLLQLRMRPASIEMQNPSFPYSLSELARGRELFSMHIKNYFSRVVRHQMQKNRLRMFKSIAFSKLLHDTHSGKDLEDSHSSRSLFSQYTNHSQQNAKGSLVTRI
jgi:hypothetical protein